MSLIEMKHNLQAEQQTKKLYKMLKVLEFLIDNGFELYKEGDKHTFTYVNDPIKLKIACMVDVNEICINTDTYYIDSQSCDSLTLPFESNNINDVISEVEKYFINAINKM